MENLLDFLQNVGVNVVSYFIIEAIKKFFDDDNRR